uniref:PINc domain-containing protein n=1 Tax=Caenorhabditis tropicalis TaxID=1561998 RepID=A0A1I7U5N7_9PELO
MLFHYQQNRAKYLCRQPENADQFGRVFLIRRITDVAETIRQSSQGRPDEIEQLNVLLNDQFAGCSNQNQITNAVETHRNPLIADSTKPNLIKVNGLSDKQSARRLGTKPLNETFNRQDIGDIGDYCKSGNRGDRVLPENYSNRASLNKTFTIGDRQSVKNQKSNYQASKRQEKRHSYGKGSHHQNASQQNVSDRQWNTRHVHEHQQNVSQCVSREFSRANKSFCEQSSSSAQPTSSQLGSCHDHHYHRGRGDHQYQPQSENQTSGNGLYQDQEMAYKSLNQTQCQFYENKTFHQGLCQNQAIEGRWIRHGEYQHIVNQRARQGQRQNQGTANRSFHGNQHRKLTNKSFHQKEHQDGDHKIDTSGKEGISAKWFLHIAAINSRVEELERQPVLFQNRRENRGNVPMQSIGPNAVQKARASSSRRSIDLNASLPASLIKTTDKATEKIFNKTIAGANEVSEREDLPKLRLQKSRLLPTSIKPTSTEASKARLHLI